MPWASRTPPCLNRDQMSNRQYPVYNPTWLKEPCNICYTTYNVQYYSIYRNHWNDTMYHGDHLLSSLQYSASLYFHLNPTPVQRNRLIMSHSHDKKGLRRIHVTLTLWSLEHVAMRFPWKSNETSWIMSLCSACSVRETYISLRPSYPLAHAN